LIIYRKAATLRTRRLPAPEPPWWAATLVSPYSGRRGAPVTIDYFDMRASWSDRLEVTVCENTAAEVQRLKLTEPVLVDATEFAEVVFRRGDEALRVCEKSDAGATFLTSTNGALPSSIAANTVVAISAWPLDFDRLEALFAAAAGQRWGLIVPVMFPVMTNLEALSQLCDLAATHEASFFAAAAVDVDPTAKQAIARSLSLDDETYAMLFHADLDPIHVATERHVAALAAERGMADAIILPHADAKSNWNGAALLMLTASRMITMEQDVDTAARIARSARAVAELNKPIARVAAAASLSIVEALDEVSVEMLTEWLSGEEPWFVQRVNREWRLRRDIGIASG
jgi:hypothetical protein